MAGGTVPLLPAAFPVICFSPHCPNSSWVFLFLPRLRLHRSVRAPSWADVLPSELTARAARTLPSVACGLFLSLAPSPQPLHISLSACPLKMLPQLRSFLGLSFYLIQSPWVISNSMTASASSPRQTAESPHRPQATCTYMPSCPLTGATRLIASRPPSTQHTAEHSRPATCSVELRPAAIGSSLCRSFK